MEELAKAQAAQIAPLRIEELRVRWVDRRVVLKTAALFGALVAGGFAAVKRDEAEAQSSTRAVDWYALDDESLVQAADVDGFITLEADFPFTAVGASWSGVLGTWPRVEIRFSDDGVNFSETIILEADVDNGLPERDGRVAWRGPRAVRGGMAPEFRGPHER